jgi:hypothetical protein
MVMVSSINEMPSRSESVWYIIKPTAHEGPYSYEQLQQKLSDGQMIASSLIWARGWPEAVEFQQLQKLFETQVTNLNFEQQVDPRIIDSFDDETLDQPEQADLSESRSRPKTLSLKFVLSLGLVVFGIAGGVVFYQLKEGPVLDRPTTVSVSEFREVKTLFENTQAPIPLPRLLSSLDFRKISLVDRSAQNCSYTLNFFSDASQNLSQEPIAFTAQAQSHQHWVVFERFDFRDGQRLIPGHYEVNLQRTACSPVGWKKMIESSHQDIALSFKQSFYSSSLQDLEKSLGLLEKKKLREAQRSKLASLEVWKEINEKLRTLKAMSSQISQDFKLLLERRIKWPERVQKTVKNYTQNHGSPLSGFLESNEADFKRISELEIPMKFELMGRAPLISGFAQRIGLVSSQLIEKVDRKGVVPDRRELEQWLKDFENSINLENSKMDMAMAEVELIIKTESASLEEAQEP